jgi:5-methylcytosine-specific restriction endonuclease McrA
LLSDGKAVVHRMVPFVIRLKVEATAEPKEYELRLDPGAKTTGVCITDSSNNAIFFAELHHRGEAVKKALDQRRGVRRSRRQRSTRYRAPRFDNRTRPDGWLAPSVKSRADNVISWAVKLSQWANIKSCVIESVSFDNSSMTKGQKLVGAQYQQGPLYQTTLRKAIIAKHNGNCVYCGEKGEEVEHIICKQNGGTDSFKNLTFSCRSCNEKKGVSSLKEFAKAMGKDYSDLAPSKTPKHAAIIQSARNYTIESIKSIGLDVTTCEGWETKFNREEAELPKEHYFDAFATSTVGAIQTNEVLVIKAQGRGKRLMTRVDRFGFPRQKAKSQKVVYGFQTGDMVRAVVLKGTKVGTHTGRVAVRETGNFNITTKVGTVQGISHKCCNLIQKGDGYGYHIKKTA